MIVEGVYDHWLVALSLLIATAASYTALDLAGRIRAAAGWSCHAWLVTSSVAMGGGIWSMHFVAMLAYSMPGMEVVYDLDLTILSLIVPILVTGTAFRLVSRQASGPPTLVFSGLFMGSGIAAMHYIGMAAMRMPAALSYTATWVAISILIAIGASSVALWLAFKSRRLDQKPVAAVAMGVAISGMHYAAMEAAVFTADPAVQEEMARSSLGQTTLALGVAAVTFVILFFALVAAMIDRRLALFSAEQAETLRRSEEQFRSLYQKTPLPLHALGEDGMIREVSDTWLDLVGRTRECVVGRPLTDFMCEESVERFQTVDQPHLSRTGRLEDVEYRLVKRDGTPLDVLLSARIEHDTEGRHLWSTGGIVDITARRRAEEALLQSQKMEAVGKLTGGVAHDFNNLLSVVLGSLRLVRKRVPDDPQLLGMIDNAIEGAERGATLTQRMLAFARKQSLTPTAIDVPELVRGMADLLRRTLGPQVHIETQFPLDLPRVEADANQLELALLNLAVNARDSMPGGGTLTIGARETSSQVDHDTSLAPGEYVWLFVTDTGLGMDEATLARARDPFFTTKPVGKGTGLGLPMVHGFAAQSGGTFALRSRKGQGTTAEIWLPVARRVVEPGLNAPDTAEEPPTAAPTTVLAVDDDALVLMNTAAMLGELGHKPIEAGSGEAALEALRANGDIRLVITDQAMPGMTGVQLAQIIRAERPDVRIVIATGYAEIPDAEALGLSIIGKPFDEETLAFAIAETLGSDDAQQRVVQFRPKGR